MANTNIFIEYAELSRLQKDSANLASVMAILDTEFPDDTCQLLAIKSILGMIPKEEEPEEPDVPDTPDEPSDPSDTDDTTDPVDPPSGDDTEPTP